MKNKIFAGIIILFLNIFPCFSQNVSLTFIPPQAENVLVCELSEIFQNPGFQKLFSVILKFNPEVEEGINRFKSVFGEDVLTFFPSVKVASTSLDSIYDIETMGIESKRILSYFNGELKRNGQMLKKETIKGQTCFVITPGEQVLTIVDNHVIFSQRESIEKAVSLDQNTGNIKKRLSRLDNLKGQIRGIWQMPEIMKINLKDSIYASRLSIIEYFCWSISFNRSVSLNIEAIVGNSKEAVRIKEIFEILLKIMLQNSETNLPFAHNILKDYDLEVNGSGVIFKLTSSLDDIIMLIENFSKKIK